jgi:hypothetical protein
VSTTTLDKARERDRVRTSISLLMALDSLDVAQGRIRALAAKAERGVYAEALHMEAIGNLERVVLEMRRAHATSASMPDEADQRSAD